MYEVTLQSVILGEHAVPTELLKSQATILTFVAILIGVIILAAILKRAGKAIIWLIIIGVIAYLLISAEVLPLK